MFTTAMALGEMATAAVLLLRALHDNDECSPAEKRAIRRALQAMRDEDAPEVPVVAVAS